MLRADRAARTGRAGRCTIQQGDWALRQALGKGESVVLIQVVIGTVRRGRQGEKVARWVADGVERFDGMTVELLDLLDYPLPFYDEPTSPTMLRGNFQSDVAKRWVADIARGDGYIFVSPEYNHGYSAVLKNALDYGYLEWNNKPAAFVSYSGGNVAGARAVEQLRLVAVELQMAPIREGLHLPGIRQLFDDSGAPNDPTVNTRLQSLLRQLLWWAETLKAGRERTA